MCLQQAVKLQAKSQTRFAVLGHDLGKATTPKDILPKHSGHEMRSKFLVEELSERLRIPNDYRQIAVIVAENHLLTHTALELRPATVLKLFKRMSAFSNPKNLKDFLIACEADARGRTGFEDREYPQKEYLLHLFEQANKVTSNAVDREKYQGKTFGEQLDKLRINAIQTARENYSESKKYHG